MPLKYVAIAATLISTVIAFEVQSKVNTSNSNVVPSTEDRGDITGISQYSKLFFNYREIRAQMNVKAGSDLTLRCPVDASLGGTYTWTYTWTYAKRGLERKKDGSSFLLRNLKSDHSGQYECRVCVSNYCLSASTVVWISDPTRASQKPSFLVPPINQTAIVGSNVTFETRVNTESVQVWRWFTGNCSGNTSSCGKESIHEGALDNEHSESLFLSSVMNADEGWYTCVITNSANESAAAAAYLHVIGSDADTGLSKLAIFVGINLTVVIILIIVLIARHRVMAKKKQAPKYKLKKVIVITHPPSPSGLQRKSKTTNLQQAPKVHIESRLIPVTNPLDVGYDYEFPIDLRWEFPRGELEFCGTLGEGAFGKVLKAKVGAFNSVEGFVAVKMLKENHCDDDATDLVCEAEVMKIIGKHENIINLLGCCTQDGPFYLIVEYAAHGNLRDFLRKHRMGGYLGIEDSEEESLSEKDLIIFAFQIARGMEYLASRFCIHRDLAARNVLVDEDLVLKIADFGLSRDVHSTNYYRKKTNGRVPVRWMAPESLFDSFYDTKSDVWSYGVLLWEIMTLGGTPYPAVTDLQNLYNYLESGERMEKPAFCSDWIYSVMRRTWQWNLNERPSFTQIVHEIGDMLDSAIIQ